MIIFFTLSGFLITYLLLEEKEQFGTIDLKGFYLRRILRIWPLYFFYIGLAMLFHWQFSAAGVENAPYVLLFVLFVPNIAFNLGRYMPDTAPLWSIGIEEQFYAMWPLVISKVKALRGFLVALIVGLVGLRVAMHAGLGSGKHLGKSIVDSLGYDSMAVGALFAILYRARTALLLRVARTPLPAAAFFALVALHAMNKLRFLSLMSPLVTSIVTGLFIVSQVAEPQRPWTLERPGLGYLGKISFGIYVYHMLVISIVIAAMRAWCPDLVLPTPVVLLVISVATITVAGLSYRFLEGPFLLSKDRLARIKSATTPIG